MDAVNLNKTATGSPLREDDGPEVLSPDGNALRESLPRHVSLDGDEG